MKNRLIWLAVLAAALAAAFTVAVAFAQTLPKGYLGTVHITMGVSTSLTGYEQNGVGGYSAGNIPASLFTDLQGRVPSAIGVHNNGTAMTEADDFLVMSALPVLDETVPYNSAEGYRYYRIAIRAGQGRGEVIAESNLWNTPTGGTCPEDICAFLRTGLPGFTDVEPGDFLSIDFYDARSEALLNAGTGAGYVISVASGTPSYFDVIPSFPAIVLFNPPEDLILPVSAGAGFRASVNDNGSNQQVTIRPPTGSNWNNLVLDYYSMYLVDRRGDEIGEPVPLVGEHASINRGGELVLLLDAGHFTYPANIPANTGVEMMTVVFEDQRFRQFIGDVEGGHLMIQFGLLMFGLVACYFSAILATSNDVGRVIASVIGGTASSAAPVFFGVGTLFFPIGFVLLAVVAGVGIYLLKGGSGG